MQSLSDDIKDTVVRNRVNEGAYVFYYVNVLGEVERLSRGMTPQQLQTVADMALDHEKESEHEENEA